MTKKEAHKIFKGFITTVRGGQIIICLGYVNAPDNFKAWTPEEEEKAIKLAKAYGLDYKKEVKREDGFNLVRIRISI